MELAMTLSTLLCLSLYLQSWRAIEQLFRNVDETGLIDGRVDRWLISAFSTGAGCYYVEAKSTRWVLTPSDLTCLLAAARRAA